MHIYVELWSAKPEWKALSETERGDFVANLGPAVGALVEGGVEIVGFAINDSDTPYRATYDYIAVWKMSSMDLVNQLERAVEQAGWHNYFVQINARGPLQTPEEVLGHSISG